MPDPDLLIRTSGEMRLSNYLLWQIAYTEIFVTERYWPDFRGIHLLEAIADFHAASAVTAGLAKIAAKWKKILSASAAPPAKPRPPPPARKPSVRKCFDVAWL